MDFLGLSRKSEWCGQEDSNFHEISPTATSTLRVYQFRHDRTVHDIIEWQANSRPDACISRAYRDLRISAGLSEKMAWTPPFRSERARAGSLTV